VAESQHDAAGDDEAQSASARWREIGSAHTDIWLSQARVWHDRARTRRVWSPEDVVGDQTNLFEHLTPIAERAIDLTIEFLRPWAKSFEERA
jgi:hypothetical protein